jgi:UDP-glucose 4-epimerase
MRSLVTGAAGFVGSALVDRLLAEGHQVIGIDNFRTGAKANLENAIHCNETSPGQFTLISLDVQAPELTGIVAGANPHIIFHLAAQVDPQASVSDPLFDARSNVLGTINLCEASRLAGVRRIVYAACEESRNGAFASLPLEVGARFSPQSPHAVAKLAGEIYLRAYAEMYDLAPMCLALGSVYGPRQNPRSSGNVVASLAGAMIIGSTFSVRRDRARARDYIYIDDVVEAFVRAGCAPMETSGTFDIGTGQHTTVAELHGLISAVMNGTPQPTVAVVPADEVSAITPDPTRSGREFGWEPVVDLRHGIQRTIRWLQTILEPEPVVDSYRIPRDVELAG